jgi:hypothetical protein
MHKVLLFLASRFNMKDMVKLMSCWTLELLKIIIVLFYLKYIMLERCFKDLSTLIIYLCLYHMIRNTL